MIVDLEHHLEPREVWEKRGGKPGQLVVQHAPDGTPLRPLDDATHDVSIHLKNMDIGGVDMAVLERMDRYIGFLGERFWQGKPRIGVPYLDNFNKYFDRLYFNMAGREAGMQTIRCALTNISPARLLFATDYPSNFIDDGQGMRAYVEKIRQLDLDHNSIEGMLGGNAIDLLGLKV